MAIDSVYISARVIKSQLKNGYDKHKLDIIIKQIKYK